LDDHAQLFRVRGITGEGVGVGVTVGDCATVSAGDENSTITTRTKDSKNKMEAVFFIFTNIISYKRSNSTQFVDKPRS
jgi:hypothetical protein